MITTRMDKKTEYKQVIAENYPDLPLDRVILHNEEGQYNDILIVNNEIIFRFPRYQEGVETIQTEVRILSRIQGYTTLPIPNPIYTSPASQRAGKVFMGYRLLTGQALWRDHIAAIRDFQILQQWASQLSSFLRELHSIPLDLVGTDLPIHDTRKEWADVYAEFQHHLYPYMRLDAREAMTSHFETYLTTPRLHTFKPALRHGDFGSGNILYDPDRQRISGIIDFGFAGIGDPALDIAAASTMGDSFFPLFYESYPEIETMLERARFYKSTFALYEALHGVKDGDKEAFEAGIASYR